jgi:hypothetical protein
MAVLKAPGRWPAVRLEHFGLEPVDFLSRLTGRSVAHQARFATVEESGAATHAIATVCLLLAPIDNPRQTEWIL